jgi:hypothetical protein
MVPPNLFGSDPDAVVVVVVSDHTPETETNVVSITVVVGNDTVIPMKNLSEPVMFDLVWTGKYDECVALPSCGWLNTTSSTWEFSGCRSTMVKNGSDSYIHCECGILCHLRYNWLHRRVNSHLHSPLPRHKRLPSRMGNTSYTT